MQTFLLRRRSTASGNGIGSALTRAGYKSSPRRPPTFYSAVRLPSTSGREGGVGSGSVAPSLLASAAASRPGKTLWLLPG